MQMQGQRTLAVNQEQAWAALNDPDVLKACVPGCDKFEGSAADGYVVGMALKIGPVSAKFSGKVSLSDVQPPQSYKLAFEGQGGAAGFGKGQSAVSLLPTPQGCELNYTVDAQVGGKIAQLGQRLIDGAAKSVADDFFKRFEGVLQQRHPEAYAIEMIAKNPIDTLGSGSFDLKKLIALILRDLTNPPWTYLAAAGVGAAIMAALMGLIA
jgi:carbon monoxide dehydrogenase subunit G